MIMRTGSRVCAKFWFFSSSSRQKYAIVEWVHACDHCHCVCASVRRCHWQWLQPPILAFFYFAIATELKQSNIIPCKVFFDCVVPCSRCRVEDVKRDGRTRKIIGSRMIPARVTTKLWLPNLVANVHKAVAAHREKRKHIWNRSQAMRWARTINLKSRSN